MMNKAEMVRMNLQSIIDDQKSVIDEQRTEIEQLRAELADARRQLQAGWIEVCQTSADLLQKDLADKLAASQAREKVLREALQAIKDRCCGEAAPRWENTPATYQSRGWIADVADQALALPTDDTALRAELAKAQEEMRERCAEFCESSDIEYEIGRTCAVGIRALEVKP